MEGLLLSGWAEYRHPVAALAATDGCAAIGSVAALSRADAPLRDVADAVHCICALHGGHPGVYDHALRHDHAGTATDWLARIASAFTDERGVIATLTAAVGPLPSTPGQADTEAVIIAQRHALDTLAASDRIGVGLGAAVALALDWPVFRRVLDAAADRAGLTINPVTLPDTGDALAMLDQLLTTPAIERAMMFGAQQLLAQHRGLWHLLEARAIVRTHH